MTKFPPPGLVLPHQYVEAGWCQGYLAQGEDNLLASTCGDDTVRVSTGGAVARASCQDMPTGKKMMAQVKYELSASGYPLDRYSLKDWNDTLGRTPQQVIDLLKHCAEKYHWRSVQIARFKMN